MAPLSLVLLSALIVFSASVEHSDSPTPLDTATDNSTDNAAVNATKTPLPSEEVPEIPEIGKPVTLAHINNENQRIVMVLVENQESQTYHLFTLKMMNDFNVYSYIQEDIETETQLVTASNFAPFSLRDENFEAMGPTSGNLTRHLTLTEALLDFQATFEEITS